MRRVTDVAERIPRGRNHSATRLRTTTSNDCDELARDLARCERQTFRQVRCGAIRVAINHPGGDNLKLLFTSRRGLGHLHPLIALASAAVGTGHEVTFVIDRELAPTVRDLGFGAAFATPYPSRPTTETHDEAMHRMVVDDAAALATNLVEIVERARPDAIVRGGLEFSAYIAAELLDVPCTSFNYSLDPGSPLAMAVLSGPIGELRERFGLAPDPNLASLQRSLNLFGLPATLLGAEPISRTTRFVRPLIFDTSGPEDIPEWVEDLEYAKTIYVTLGTTAWNKYTPMFRVALEAFADAPVNVIMTVGRDADPSAFGPQPSHIKIAKYIPQSRLLPYCDLVICHGGFNTAITAVMHGVPMVITPAVADQPVNAFRCEQAGVSLTSAPATTTPSVLRQLADRVLSDASFQQRASELEAECRNLPNAHAAVTWVEELAKPYKPLASSPL